MQTPLNILQLYFNNIFAMKYSCDHIPFNLTRKKILFYLSTCKDVDFLYIYIIYIYLYILNLFDQDLFGFERLKPNGIPFTFKSNRKI